MSLKEVRKVEWLDMMKHAIDYMEDNMDKEIYYDEMAKEACSSSFHFQRMFHMITGMTVADYIRKRRLTLAAQELAISTKIKVIEVALKYGYETPEAFTKAFKKAHGITPSAAREPGISLKAFPRISFHLSLKGDKDMDYKIIEKEAFRVVGKELKVSTKDGENLQRIPKFWDEVNQDGTNERLCSLSDKTDVLGICMDMEHDKEAFTYMIAVEATKNSKSSEFTTREIPAATWAVFTSIGAMPTAIQKVWERIFSEWFPSTGYEHAEAPELEVYPEGNTNSEDYRCEVWVPIIKK
jgi:AraC family transcriptional regulator